MVQAIDVMRARVDGADGLAGALAAGWDAFELIREAALLGADRAGGLFAAFVLASAAAVWTPPARPARGRPGSMWPLRRGSCTGWPRRWHAAPATSSPTAASPPR